MIDRLEMEERQQQGINARLCISAAMNIYTNVVEDYKVSLSAYRPVPATYILVLSGGGFVLPAYRNVLASYRLVLVAYRMVLTISRLVPGFDAIVLR